MKVLGFPATNINPIPIYTIVKASNGLATLIDTDEKNHQTNNTLQMIAGIYRDFAGKLECGDFKFTGIACIPTIPVIFEVNQKSVDLFIYTLY